MALTCLGLPVDPPPRLSLRMHDLVQVVDQFVSPFHPCQMGVITDPVSLGCSESEMVNTGMSLRTVPCE